MQPVSGLKSLALAQLCIVVDDADKYAARYAKLFGIPIPPPHLTDDFTETRATYNCQPTEAKARVYVWQFGDVDFELLQPLGPGSVWHDWLMEHGPSVHHVALRATDTDGVVKEFARFGHKVLQRGFFTDRFPDGGHTGVYTYISTPPKTSAPPSNCSKTMTPKENPADGRSLSQ